MRWRKFENFETKETYLQFYLYGYWQLGWGLKIITQWQRSVGPFFGLCFSFLFITYKTFWRYMYGLINLVDNLYIFHLRKNNESLYFSCADLIMIRQEFYSFPITVGHVDRIKPGCLFSTVSLSATNDSICSFNTPNECS